MGFGGFSGGVCALPNWTGKQQGMAGLRGMGLDIDWTQLGTTLLNTAGQIAGQYAPQQQQQPTVIYQQVPAQQQAAPTSGGSSNTVLWVVGGVAALGLVGYLAYRAAQRGRR